jgi:hypothetical protein
MDPIHLWTKTKHEKITHDWSTFYPCSVSFASMLQPMDCLSSSVTLEHFLSCETLYGSFILGLHMQMLALKSTLLTLNTYTCTSTLHPLLEIWAYNCVPKKSKTFIFSTLRTIFYWGRSTYMPENKQFLILGDKIFTDQKYMQNLKFNKSTKLIFKFFS